MEGDSAAAGDVVTYTKASYNVTEQYFSEQFKRHFMSHDVVTTKWLYAIAHPLGLQVKQVDF